MNRRLAVRQAAVGLVATGCVISAPLVDAGPDPGQTAPQFRVSTTLVPVDVRVLDRRGKPVTDLAETDFTVVEDGRPQTVSFFSGHGLAATDPNPEALTLLRDPRNAVVGPQNHRVFLLVLGRGRLQPPAKGVDAMIEFVRERLLPQDHVGILAWNRATDLTTEHDRILAVLERFKREHERIESLMRQRFTGLTAVYGGSKIPDTLQTRINAVFNGPEEAGTRALPEAQNDNRARLIQEQRQMIDQLMNASPENVTGAGEADAFDLGFDDYVEGAAQTNQDISNLYTGIEYLRHLSGEKHIVLVTEQGLQLPRMEDSTSLAAVANDARVVIDTIHTGGLPPAMAAPPNASLQTTAGGRPYIPPTATHRQRVADLRTISTLTGGISSVFQYANRGATRIADATSFQYLLGYYPTNSNWNGRYRNIRVQVNRPDVTVLYRRGYYGSRQLPAMNRREMLTYSRITGAANYDRDVPDIEFEGTLTQDGTGVTVNLTIAAARLMLAEQAGQRSGTLKVAAFAGDRLERVVGEVWQDVDLSYTPARYEEILKTGVPHEFRVPVIGVPTYVKVVVYDQNADLIGSRTLRIR